MAGRPQLRGLIVVLALATAVPAAAADLTGRWRIEPSYWGPFAEIQQDGNSVEIVLDPYPTYPFDGTFSGSQVNAFTNGAPCIAELTFRLLPDGRSLDGSIEFYGGDCTGTYQNYHLLLTRCDCDDGNSSDGDGCDASCQVEPCYSCSGEPLVCSPSVDGSACDDGDTCTSGETCSGGVCGNGSPIGSCIDLSGRWLRYLDTDLGPFLEEADIEQHNGTITFKHHSDGSVGYVGTIDSLSGVFDVSTPNAGGVCHADDFHGQAAASGLRYSGSGTGYGWGGMVCADFDYEEFGYRCAVLDNGNCVVDSCTHCTGDDCAPYPDGTLCDDGDPCTVISVCSAGSCVVEQELDCPVCSICDGAGGCVAAPRNDCRGEIEQSSTKLQLDKRDSSSGDKLRWQYKRGAETLDLDLGRPDVDDDVGFCLFDESGPAPVLIFQSIIPGGFYCQNFGFPCWHRLDDGSFEYKDEYGFAGGITSMTLQAGGNGKASVAMKAAGLGLTSGQLLLPTPQLNLPLRAQVQVRHAACFDGSYDEQSISRNSDGKLRARKR
ncbi:MAG TPA: hypothetical protein VN634_21620 [Candidatus Limnocylindrales bacterium]|nr:hypothetical protein [Candidatus Limnocylindrales bacterium]